MSAIGGATADAVAVYVASVSAVPIVTRRTTLLFLALLALTGCAHIGPHTVVVDRFDYSSAIADSWKQQTLLNIVKLRYLDLPVFVEVSSIVSGYSLQTGVSVGGTVSSRGAVQGNLLSTGAQGIYTDRPTVTYTPNTGEKFLRGLVAPIDPKNIFSLLQSGYAADFVLPLTVESLNGLRNRSAVGGRVREADPEFTRVVELLRELQTTAAFGMRVEEDTARGAVGVVLFRPDNLTPDIAEKAAETRRLLKLSPTGQKFTLVYSPAAGADGELAVNSRSMLQIMGAFASYVEVPAADVKEQRALPGLDNTPSGVQRAVSIHSGDEKPADVFAVVRYRDHWFWIDDRDLQSKRAFTAIMFFFTLADSGGGDHTPIITIPAQ